MEATVIRESTFDGVTESYKTTISFTYLDGVDEVSTRELKFEATSPNSQDEADNAAAAELRGRVISMTDYLDSQFPV